MRFYRVEDTDDVTTCNGSRGIKSTGEKEDHHSNFNFIDERTHIGSDLPRYPDLRRIWDCLQEDNKKVS